MSCKNTDYIAVCFLCACIAIAMIVEFRRHPKEVSPHDNELVCLHTQFAPPCDPHKLVRN